MSDEAISPEDVQKLAMARKINDAKQKFGDLIVLELEGKTLAFKRFSKAQLTELKKRINAKPDLVIELTANACQFQCVIGAEFFADLADKYPIVFCGDYQTKGVSDYLMDLARGGADGPQIRVE